MRDDKIYTCITCKLTDPKVECAGIYYCPNPFCSVSGSTNWKMDNLKGIIVDKTGITMTEEAYKDWLVKGMDAIDKLPYALAHKIMQLRYTKKIIKNLKKIK